MTGLGAGAATGRPPHGAFLAGLAAAAGALDPHQLAAENAALIGAAAVVREVVAALPERDRMLI